MHSHNYLREIRGGLSLESVPIEERTKELCLEAVKRHWSALRFVPCELLTEELYFEGIKQSGQAWYQIHNNLMKTQRICLEAVKEIGMDYTFPEAMKTESVWIEMAKSGEEAFLTIRDDKKTLRLCLEAVKQDKRLLRYLPPAMKTETFYRALVKENWRALFYLPVNMRLQVLDAVPEALRQEFGLSPESLQGQDSYLVMLNHSWLTYNMIPEEDRKETIRNATSKIFADILYADLLEKSSDIFLFALRDNKKLPQQLLSLIKKIIFTRNFNISTLNCLKDSETENKIIMLYSLFGDKLFSYLESLVTHSTVNIDRFFSSFRIYNNNIVPAYAVLLESLQENSEYKKSTLGELALLVAVHDFLTHTQPLDARRMELTRPILKNAKDIKDYLIKSCLQCENFSEFTIKREIPNLNEILTGLPDLPNENYRQLMTEMIQADLSESFGSFIHDTEQKNPLGKKIALHNQKIDQKLAEKGIHLKLFQAYPLKKRFLYGETSETEKSVEALMLMMKHILTMLEAKGSQNSDYKPALKNMSNFMNQGFVKKQKKGVFNKQLATYDYSRLIQSLSAAATKTQDQALEEQCRLLNDQINNLRNIAPEKKNTEKAAQPFHVEQWDKANPDTFLLGNYLSCCLANNGERFYALLERRIDNACFMHVVINENTGEPVSGNWLYLAENESGEILVVANFFEIRVSCASNPELRDLLVKELSEFTSQFAIDIGAKGFIIQPLFYGNIPDTTFSHCLDKQVSLSKPGGFLVFSKTESNYFLRSLNTQSFHDYPLPACSQKLLDTESNFFQPANKTSLLQKNAEVVFNKS